jgi:CheY-like chemotaxis protein
MKAILLVEDAADLRELVAFLLRREGYEVHEAEHGQDALDQLETMNPAPGLLLLDLMMPVMSGLELLETLGKDDRFSSLPVVVLSAGGQPSQVPSAKKFLRKPADPQLIVSVAREYCGAPD